MNSASQSEASSETAGARKLIAIVHADIVGYSRHINRDDAGTLDRVRMIRRDLIDPELRKHGGRLVNTAGDALLIEFASITAAVQCAVEVQRRVPEFDGDLPPSERIRFRIGINIGDPRAPIFMAMASTSRPGFRQPARSAAFASRARCATMCASSSI